MPDLRFQQLTSATPILTDIIPYVKDPSGVPLDRKATFQDIVTLAGGSLQTAYDGGNNILQTASAPVIIRNNGIAYGNQPDVGPITDVTGDKIQLRLGDNRTTQNVPMDGVAQTILDDTAVTFVAGETYTASTIAFFDNNPAADTITDSAAQFVIEGFVIGDTITITGSTSNNGSYTIAGVTAGTITLDDAGTLVNEAAGASVTITSASNKIDFGVNLATLSPIPAAVAGITTHIIGLSLLVLKDSSVAADETTYSINYLMDGGATNSVAIVSKLDTTIPTLTSVSGTAKIFNPVDAISGRASLTGGGPLNVRIFTPGMGDPTAIGAAEFIDSTTLQFGHALFNAGSITSALDVSINLGPAFGETADVPFKQYATFGGPSPNAPDHIFLARTADPTNLAPFGPGGLWYNTTAGVFKYYDGATTQTLGTSSSSDLFDTTVASSGGDFTTVNAALVAGKRRIKVTGATVTETTDTTIASGGISFFVFVDRNTTWDFATFKFIWASANHNVTIWGADRESSQIVFAHTDGDPLFDMNGLGATLKLSTLFINNNSSVLPARIVTNGRWIAEDLQISIPNVAGDNGLHANTSWDGVFANNIWCVGTGANSSGAITMDRGSASNLFFDGTWSTAVANPMLLIGAQATATNVVYALATAAKITVEGGTISNIEDAGGAASADITITAASAVISSASLGTGDIDLQTFTNCHLTDCFSDGLLDMSDINCGGNFIAGCKFDTNMTVAGNSNQFTNFKTDGNLTVSGQQNQFATTSVLGNYTCSGALNQWNGLDLPAVAVNLVSGASNKFVNFYSSSSLNTTQIGNQFTNGEVAGATTISGTKCRIVNCRYIANSALALSITGDETCVVGVQAGQDAGAGIGTITIGAGAARVSVTGCHTDVAIVDNNGGAGLSNNFIY